mgnify:CR=1 FL=1
MVNSEIIHHEMNEILKIKKKEVNKMRFDKERFFKDLQEKKPEVYGNDKVQELIGIVIDRHYKKVENDEIVYDDDLLLELYDIIGYLDAIIAIASFRDSVETYCIPQFEMEKEHSKQLKMQMLYHPLIKNPVKNSIDTDKSILFTGSNASGKSTFLKAVAINVLFAQTIHTVLADEYCSSFYRIYSSMALRDDILSQESYFIVELKSLKRIFTKIREDDVAVLCFIDEILRGTNTVERVAASSQLLEEIAKKNALCFAATHDIELTYLLEDIYQNCHFEEVLQDGDVSFDYLLKEGRANSRNAIRLLEVIGFDKEVVKRSQQRVDRFLQKGIWE